jgi:hypothetical protein
MSQAESKPPADSSLHADDGTRQAVPPFVIGWEEWLALPALALPAIKAKVDTGAKTSALHAFLIEPFTDSGRSLVRFGIHPIPGREDIEVFCTSPLVDRREVTSSNGDKEARYVITTPVTMGQRTWDIEVTLTNREGMAYRMLLGRQAIRDGMLVDPAASFRQPRLSHRLYGRVKSTASAESRFADRASADRSFDVAPKPTTGLRIAVLTRQLNSGSNRRLAEAAHQRGHALQLLDLATLTLGFAPHTPMLRGADDVEIDAFDFVVPRFVGGNGAFGAAIVRALEFSDCQGLNAGDALDLLRNPLALAQALVRAGARQIQGGVSEISWPERLKSGTKTTPETSILTVGGRAIAGIALQDSVTTELPRVSASDDFAAAERIARTLGLGLASVDFGSDDEGRIVVRVSGSPRLGLFERITGVRVADAVLNVLEARARLAAADPDVSADAGLDDD